MEAKDGLSAAVLEVLDKANYVAWSVRVKTYLMVQDLWEVVEATTEPPKQEDDEAAFKAWSDKNSTALHVIHVSCGPHALSVIRQISSAKIAWNTLAVVLQVLEKDNYLDWSVRVKTYLMAHDLWEIIEGTTEPPRQENDEATFKAWTKKNSKALHVIQISCGPDTFSEIIQISSPKIAWDTLAKKFLQVLEEDTYEEWSVRVKTYLIAHDLWDIIEGTTEPPKQQDDGASFKAWSKKNSMALHVIQMLCGPDTFYEIIQINSAKIAWDTLAQRYYVPPDTESGNDENGTDDLCEPLKMAMQIGDWDAAVHLLTNNPGVASAQITYLGETALHVAVEAGHEDIVEKLVDVMSEEDLEIQDCYGMTALVGAINAGNYRMTQCMLRKNNNLLSIKNSNGQIPLIHAISKGHIELAHHLYSLTVMEDLLLASGDNGATLCTQVIYTRSLDIAFDLLLRFPHLALALDYQGLSPFYALAAMPYAFSSGDRLVFWKRWIYSGIYIQPGSATEEIRLHIPNEEYRRSDHVIKIIGLVKSLLRRPVS